MNTYESHGIIVSGDSGQVRAKCPVCPTAMPYRHDSSHNSKDLSVDLDKGVWKCHRCGWAGGLKTEGVWRQHDFPEVPTSSKPYDSTASMYKFFDSRGISASIVDRNLISIEKLYRDSKDYVAICFNYFVGDTKVAVKYRGPNKTFSQAKGGSKVFYKLNDIDGVDTCIIVEGEIDALSFEAAGYRNAVSVPEGAIQPNDKNLNNKMKFLDNTIDWFADKKVIYIATDTDAPGVRLREELARRLGKSRCMLVLFPDDCKDANDVLVKHGVDKLIECIESATPYPVEGVKTAESRSAEYKYLWQHGLPNPSRTGWSKFDEYVKMYDSTLTVVTGIPSHGKSSFVDHLMLQLAQKSGWKWAVFSPENAKLELHLMRLAEILVGKPFLPNYQDQMSKSERDSALQYVNENIYFVEPVNTDNKLKNILDGVSYLISKYGVKGVVIDPWNAIDHDYGGSSETDYVCKTLNELINFERYYGVHLIIVAHPTKIRKNDKSKKYEIPTLYDIAGSAHWYNKCEIGICVYREFDDKLEKTLHTKVLVQKAKHKLYGRTGMLKFGFNPQCQRFYEFNSGERNADTQGISDQGEADDEPPF